MNNTMNAKLNEAPGPDEIESLLPWYAAGTLSRRDAARVEQALSRDAELSRRFERVREELAATIGVNETLGAPSARAMTALFQKIDAEPARKPAVSFNLMGRLAAFMDGLRPRTLAYAGGVAVLALVLQAGVITGLIGERGRDAQFRTVAVEQPAAKADGVQALVRFTPQASAADITAFLEASNATVIGGPAAGTYRLRIAAAKDQASEIVKKLQDNKVVSFAAAAQ